MSLSVDVVGIFILLGRKVGTVFMIVTGLVILLVAAMVVIITNVRRHRKRPLRPRQRRRR